MNCFKYQKYIDGLINNGITMPLLFEPNGKEAFRYVFANENGKNHKPVSIINPIRVLPDDMKFSGYALSCYNDERKAVSRYKNLCKINKKMPLILGDALCRGILQNGDGMVSEINKETGHFDFYEYENCNPFDIFTIIKQVL